MQGTNACKANQMRCHILDVQRVTNETTDDTGNPHGSISAFGRLAD